MAVLITGGAGYIGSHTALALLKKDREIVVVDNLSRGHREALSGGKFYEGDLRDEKFLEEVFSKENITAVVHFAADSQVGESVKDPLKYFDNNLKSAITLLSVMKRHGVSYFVFSSSAAVYGEPKGVPILESDETNPTNPYGETKLMIEKILQDSEKAYGLKFAALRYFNAAGADSSGKIGEDHTPETHLIPIVLEAAAGKRGKMQVFGDDYDTPDGTCVRDYIHVSDLASAHVKALTYLENGGKSGAFNLGNGKGFSVLEVIKAAELATGMKVPYEMAPRREGDPASLVASSEKAKNVLSWEISHPDLQEIIADAWNFHKNYPNGF